MTLEDFDLTERELFFYFALGFVLGLIVLRLSRDVLEAWVIESDLGERRRIREELERWWRELPQDEPHEEPDAAELPAVGELTREASRPRITAITEGAS